MLILQNAVFLPKDGIYKREKISKEEFKELMQVYDRDFKSLMRYGNACGVVKEVTGILPEICLDSTDYREGDILLCVCLKYRLQKVKGDAYKHGNNVRDYEFIKITYYGDCEVKKK